ncbi:MAG: hypothetical protein GY801_26125 [bacterium]|nr:hypothetical protein [bacterium]
MERVLQAITSEISHLDSLCHDWAAWDDTYDFAESPSEDYNESNLVLTSFTDSGLNLIYLYNSEGPIRGSTIMGRFLDSDVIKSLADQTRVDFQLFPIYDDSLPDMFNDISNQLSPESPYAIERDDDNYLQVYLTIPDINDDAALIICADIPRKIAAKDSMLIPSSAYFNAVFRQNKKGHPV